MFLNVELAHQITCSQFGKEKGLFLCPTVPGDSARNLSKQKIQLKVVFWFIVISSSLFYIGLHTFWLNKNQQTLWNRNSPTEKQPPPSIEFGIHRNPGPVPSIESGPHRNTGSCHKQTVHNTITESTCKLSKGPKTHWVFRIRLKLYEKKPLDEWPHTDGERTNRQKIYMKLNK